MSDSPGREARLRPEFAHLYPAITEGQWDSAAVMADRMVAWLLRNPQAGFIATDRILPPEHFDFRGDTPRPGSLTEGLSRRGDQPSAKNSGNRGAEAAKPGAPPPASSEGMGEDQEGTSIIRPPKHSDPS